MSKTLNKLKFRRWLGVPRRLARRRGFGIHSPFAFDFVRRVIASHYSYYAYPQLTAVAREGHIRPGLLRLIFRLALFFRPTTATIDGLSATKTNAIAEAIKAASPDTTIIPDRADFMVVTADVSTDKLKQAVQRHGVVIMLGTTRKSLAVREVWTSTDSGMLFRGSNVAIFVALPHLPHQIFNIWI